METMIFWTQLTSMKILLLLLVSVGPSPLSATETHGLFGSNYLFTEFKFPTDPRAGVNNRAAYARKFGPFGTKLIADLGNGVHHKNHQHHYYNPHLVQKRNGYQAHNPHEDSYNQIKDPAKFYPTKSPTFRPPPITRHPRPTAYFPVPKLPLDFVIAPFALFNPGGDQEEGFTLSPVQQRLQEDRRRRKRRRRKKNQGK